MILPIIWTIVLSISGSTLFFSGVSTDQVMLTSRMFPLWTWDMIMYPLIIRLSGRMVTKLQKNGDWAYKCSWQAQDKGTQYSTSSVLFRKKRRIDQSSSNLRQCIMIHTPSRRVFPRTSLHLGYTEMSLHRCESLCIASDRCSACILPHQQTSLGNFSIT